MHRFVSLALVSVVVYSFAHSVAAQNAWDVDLDALKRTVGLLSRQVMMQQLAAEERVRSDGDSGIKLTRLNDKGTNPYLTQTYTRRSNSAIHDHSNNIRTVGMGEVAAVLNGVEFRSRHNDFRLYMPSRTTSTLDAVEDVPFPEVPPEVTSKATVDEEVAEMRLWFQAFKEQNYTVRDYRNYFKPVLCYMEGAWTFSDPGTIDEPFDSDRHEIDAISWFDLQDKIRFTSSTGTKSNAENFAFLPTTIASIANETTPLFAQWNYKILCHPLNRDLPLNRLQMVDDFASRMVFQYTMPRQERSRAARYRLNPLDTDEWPNEMSYNTGLLDEIMYEVPGRDNYPADLADDAFGMVTTQPSGAPLNAGYYHRIFKTTKKGAMGLELIHRGFNDQSLYVALNTQPTTMGVSYESCTGGKNNQVCTAFEQKVSYAIPLEIIYVTPLYKWNPHKILYRGNSGDPGTELVRGDGSRTGFPSKEKAFDGIHSKLYYITPVELFHGSEVNADPADTSLGAIGVLGEDGEVKNVTASGTRITTPPIGDIGTVRLRYPINPVHADGSVTRKELEAIKMAFLEPGNFQHMIREPIDVTSSTTAPGHTVIKLGASTSEEITPHDHTIDLDGADLKKLLVGELVSKYSSTGLGHRHYITFKYIKSDNVYKITVCDSLKLRCWDLHPREMYEIPDTTV